nr:hypothetical protein [Denitromonas sp.]
MSEPLMQDAGPAASVLAWLAGEPADDPVEGLQELSDKLDELMRAELTPIQLHRGVELFFMRVRDVREVLVPRLVERALPLPSKIFNAVSRLEGICLVLANGYERVMADLGSGVVTQRRRPEVLATQALTLLGDVLWLAGMKGAT